MQVDADRIVGFELVGDRTITEADTMAARLSLCFTNYIPPYGS